MTKSSPADTTFSPINNLMFGTMSRLNGALLDAVVEFQREAVGFVGKRLTADMKLQRDLMEVREVSDMGKLQQDWLSDAMADYSAEATKLLSLMTRAAKEEAGNWASAQSEVSKAFVEQTEAFTRPLAAE